jgi:hypothetical protein
VVYRLLRSYDEQRAT